MAQADSQRIAGAEMRESRPHTCRKCQADLLLGLVPAAGGGLKWVNFDRKAETVNGLLVFRRHRCRF